MKKLILLLATLLFVLIFSFGFSQNLVPNPSFEQYDSCTTAFGSFNGYCSSWQSYSMSPDYYNVCCLDTTASVPNNAAGYQNPITGVAYAGIVTYVYCSTPYRECIGAELITPLVIGEVYSIRFKISRAETFSTISTDKIGIKFTNQTYDDFTSPIPVDNQAHVYIDSIISDTLNWYEYQGVYTADDSYRYIVLGNFFDDTTINLFPNDTNGFGYYYIDDIYVGKDSLTLLNESENIAIELFPNPTTGKITIQAENIIGVEVMDIQGLKVKSQKSKDKSQSFEINISQQPKGIYIIKVTTNKGVVVEKVVLE